MRSPRIVLVFAVAALALCGYAAWRWYPRADVPATPEMRAAMAGLSGANAQAGSEPPSPPADPSTDRERLMAAAYALRGVPYSYGAKGPDRLDCSGFTKAVYAKVGVTLPDGSFNQAEGEEPLTSLSQMQPGDLILYRWDSARGVKHVTMYAGGGWVIGTGSPGQVTEVTVYPLSDDLVGDGRVLTYRHILLPDER